MPNIGSLLKTEIARVARREIRAELGSLRKASGQHRSTIAALRREVQALTRQLRVKASATSADPEPGEQETVKRRFSAPKLAKHRQALGLSARDYAKLVGVTGQTIYKWETGAVRPRSNQIEALAAVRGFGRREVAARLEELAKSQEPKRAAAKRSRTRARTRTRSRG